MSKYDKDTKFYWLQLKEDFFEDDAIQWLEEQENGKDYCYFYLKLCLKSLKNNGILIRKVGKMLIPYDAKKLSELTGTNFDTVIVAMKLLEQIGLIEILDDGEIYLTQIEEMIGSKSKGAFKKQQQRALKNDNLLIENKKADICPPNCPPEIEIEIELEKEKEIEIDKEQQNEIYTDNNQSSNSFINNLSSTNQSIYQFFSSVISANEFIKLTDKYGVEFVFERFKRLKDNLQAKNKQANEKAYGTVETWCKDDSREKRNANNKNNNGNPGIYFNSDGSRRSSPIPDFDDTPEYYKDFYIDTSGREEVYY